MTEQQATIIAIGAGDATEHTNSLPPSGVDILTGGDGLRSNMSGDEK